MIVDQHRTFVPEDASSRKNPRDWLGAEGRVGLPGRELQKAENSRRGGRSYDSTFLLLVTFWGGLVIGTGLAVWYQRKTGRPQR
ncbi:MAG: hypothetical protein ACT4OO_15125 [Nitrospiraceae bacterium]